MIGGESDERYFAGERYALEQFGEEHESPVQYADEKGDAPAAVSVIGIDSGCQRLYLAVISPCGTASSNVLSWSLTRGLSLCMVIIIK